MVYFRLFAPLLLVIGLFACRHDAHDAHDATDTGVRTIDSSLPHDVFRARLVAAIADNGLRVLDGACGKCSIKTIDVPANDTEIITVYGPDLTLRMMQAGAAAGSDAPLRFYLTRLEDGTTHALAVFSAPDLKPVAEELDRVFAHIVDAVD
jgi:uncharacterized protein (DUF302 family)